MNNDSSLKMQVAITMLPKLNSFLYMPLLEACGGIEGFFHENETALAALYRDFNLKTDTFDRKTALEKAEHELSAIDKHTIKVCSVEHSNFPPLLKQCEDAPLVFFYKGTLETDEALKYLAIVGTRKASERCKGRVSNMIRDIKEMGHSPVIVSGLAFGIDASAHTASLAEKLKTYAVLGHGLHMIYPSAHKNIADKILAGNGALISEYPCCASILPCNFLQRNRIVAGLCHATLVAESAEKGGAMATARIALSYARDVLALPGRPEDKMSAGCNLLIKQNAAALVENGTDVANVLGLNSQRAQPRQTNLNLFDADDNENIILNILTHKGETNIDELSILAHISIHQLAATLLQLELEGKVMPLPGKNYTIC